MAVHQCPACGNPASGNFCPQCGASLSARPASGRERRAWWAAGIFGLVALITLVLVARQSRVSAAAGPVTAEAAPPDLSSLTPRGRFDSLYNRVMRAAENGDTATVTQFSPLVTLSYRQLDTIDADARYHMAVLQLHVLGGSAAALQLADSILATNPNHLFGYLIRGTAARLSGDNRLLQRANAGFLAAWDAEMKAGRPEYRDHQSMLEQFRAGASKEAAGQPARR